MKTIRYRYFPMMVLVVPQSIVVKISNRSKLDLGGF